jgi:hypothetical protein
VIFPAFPQCAGLHPDRETGYPRRIKTAISWTDEGKKEIQENKRKNI